MEHQDGVWQRKTCLYYAGEDGRVAILKALLDKSKDVGANILNLAAEDGSTALIMAAACGNTDCVKCLIEAGAELNL